MSKRSPQSRKSTAPAGNGGDRNTVAGIQVRTPPSVAHSSRIELSRSALKKNLAFLRERVGKGTTISSVVKANAYGHGIDPFVPLAESCGVEHFSVASSQEAADVLAVASPNARIMIMGILYEQDLPWVIEHGVEFFVFDLARLELTARVAREVGRPARAHLEVETGGNRTGLPEDDLADAIALLKREKQNVHFAGVCTHFAGIESLANQFRIQRQRQRFEAVLKRLRSTRCIPESVHAGCSAAALAYPETAMDMVRVGTAQYGMWPSPEVSTMVQQTLGRSGLLHRVMSWKTDIMHVKKVRQDDFIGYGTTFQAPRPMTIAVLPVGYSNGIPRALSNRGHVLVRGRKAPIVGAVNMNVFMIDITHIPDVVVGDEVVLVGKQKNNSISLRSFAEFDNVLNNEFVSRLPAAIPRVVVR